MSVRYDVVRDVRRRARVAVGINTYDGGDRRVSNLLRSMRHVGGLPEDAALTLLDDGSQRPYARIALALLAEEYGANCIQHRANMGITAGWNSLVGFVDAEFHVLLNDDLILTPGWLRSLVYFLEHNECGGVGLGLWFCIEDDVPRLLAGERVTPRDPHTKEERPELGEVPPDGGPGAMMCPPGCAFGFRRSTYDAVGGFDPRFVQSYNESDFGTRAAELGMPSYVVPWPRVWHLWSKTFQENPHLGRMGSRDGLLYREKWSGDFTVTNPRYMSRIPPRNVRWLDRDGVPQEREMVIS